MLAAGNIGAVFIPTPGKPCIGSHEPLNCALLMESISETMEHFRDGRTVRIMLPATENGSATIDVMVRYRSGNLLEVALPTSRSWQHQFHRHAECLLLYGVQGRPFKLQTRIEKILGPCDLLVKALAPPKPLREREFFRVDMELGVGYRRVVPDQEEPPPFQILRTMVNLSGCGIRLPLPEEWSRFDQVELQLQLVSSEEVLTCRAEVVRTCYGEDGVLQVALQFYELASADRDKIVAGCLARQREILRNKVRTREWH